MQSYELGKIIYLFNNGPTLMCLTNKIDKNECGARRTVVDSYLCEILLRQRNKHNLKIFPI